MPNVSIVDTHVHLWNPQRFRMRWLDDNAVLNRSYELSEYDKHAHGIGIEAMLYMEVAAEPAYSLLEAQWADVQAEREPRLRGIVAYAPLKDGEPVRSHLNALKAIGPRSEACGESWSANKITISVCDPISCEAYSAR